MTGSTGGDEATLPWELALPAEEVARRLEWGRTRGHPDYVWPEVPPGSWRKAVREIEDIVRRVLVDEPASLAERDDQALRALGVAAFTSGTGPLLGRWVEDGRLDAAPEVARLLAVHLAHGRIRAERFRTVLDRAVDALADIGVRPLLLKGGHTGPVYFPESGARPAADLDLMVDPERFEAAEAALRGAGFTPTGRQRRPLKSDWLAPGSAATPRSLEVAHGESQYAVDLHASLARNFFGVRTVTLPATRTPAGDPPGPDVDVLAQPALFALHALHASEGLHSLTLVRLVELALVARRDQASGDLDDADLAALLDEADAWRFVYPALALAERLAPGTVAKPVLERAHAAAPRAMRRVLGPMRPADAHRPEALSLRERFMWCAGPGDHVRRLLHMVAPAPAGRSPARLIRTYVDRLRRIGRGTVARRDDERAG